MTSTGMKWSIEIHKADRIEGSHLAQKEKHTQTRSPDSLMQADRLNTMALSSQVLFHRVGAEHSIADQAIAHDISTDTQQSSRAHLIPFTVRVRSANNRFVDQSIQIGNIHTVVKHPIQYGFKR